MSKHSENRSNIFDAIDNDDVRAKAAVSSHQGQQSAERPSCIFLTGGVQSSPAARCGAGKQISLIIQFDNVTHSGINVVRMNFILIFSHRETDSCGQGIILLLIK